MVQAIAVQVDTIVALVDIMVAQDIIPVQVVQVIVVQVDTTVALEDAIVAQDIIVVLGNEIYYEPNRTI